MASENTSANVQLNSKGVVEQVVNAATATYNTVASATAAASHATLEKTHAAAESYNANLAVSETLDGKTRMEAAKSALEHHTAVKEHRELKEMNVQAAGLPDLTAKATDMASAAKDSAMNAAVAAKDSAAPTVAVVQEKATNAAVMAKDAAVNTATYVQEKATTAAVATKDAAINTAAYVQEKASTAAIVTKDAAVNTATYVQEKASNAATVTKDAAVNTATYVQDKTAPVVAVVQDKAGPLKDQVVNAATTTYNTMASATAAASHATLEKTHAVAESYNANLAISETLDTRDRMEAAKSALEHHAAAKEHRELKETNAEAAGLPNLVPTATAAVQAIPGVLGTAASTAGSYVMAGASAVYNAAVSGTHTVLQAKDNYQADSAKAAAVDESLPAADRMDAAKAALELDLSAKSHASVASASKTQ